MKRRQKKKSKKNKIGKILGKKKSVAYLRAGTAAPRLKHCSTCLIICLKFLSVLCVLLRNSSHVEAHIYLLLSLKSGFFFFFNLFQVEKKTKRRRVQELTTERQCKPETESLQFGFLFQFIFFSFLCGKLHFLFIFFLA